MADPAGRAAVTNRLRALRVCFKKQGKSHSHRLGACREIAVEGQEFVDGPVPGCSAAGRKVRSTALEERSWRKLGAPGLLQEAPRTSRVCCGYRSLLLHETCPRAGELLATRDLAAT